MPTVFKKAGKQRLGRGFSREELKKAGIDAKSALKHKIPIDLRRRTAHEENVQKLQTILESIKAQSKPAKKKREKRKSKS
jgi:large subunit ribosomal protein L13e